MALPNPTTTDAVLFPPRRLARSPSLLPPRRLAHRLARSPSLLPPRRLARSPSLMVLGAQTISSQAQGLSSAATTSAKGPANFAAFPNIVKSFSSLSNLEPPALPAPASASPHTQGRHRRASSLNSVFQPDHSSSATAVDATANTALTHQSSLHSLACPTAGPATPRHTSDTSRCPFPDCTMRPSLAAYFKHVSQHIQGYFSGGPVEPCAEWLAHFGKVICPTCRSLFMWSVFI